MLYSLFLTYKIERYKIRILFFGSKFADKKGAPENKFYIGKYIPNIHCFFTSNANKVNRAELVKCPKLTYSNL